MVPPAAAIAQRGPRPILIFLRQQRMVSPAAAVATTRSVSDSNLRSCKEEWPACRGRRDNDLPLPILIIVAAKKNGSPAGGSSDDDLPRPNLFFVAAKKNGPPAAAVATTIFRVRF